MVYTAPHHSKLAMHTTFNFNDPNIAHLEANYPYAWDPVEAAKFVKL